jgi:FHS family L-fucose permease-like MFS transporter
MGFFKKPTLRTRDDQRTSAAELTLRASILPLCLVTILFFLWVHLSPSFDSLSNALRASRTASSTR